VGRGSGALWWAAVLVLLGIILLLDNFDVVDFGGFVLKLWPLLLVWWGVSLLRRDRSWGPDGIFGDRSGTFAVPVFEQSTVFGDCSVRIAGPRFERATVKTVFGDITVDMSAAEAIAERAALDVHCVFGDITLRIPERFAFEITGSAAFGGLSTPPGTVATGNTVASPGFDAAVRRLSISAHRVFGDLNVTR
jgi:hypothetical protein